MPCARPVEESADFLMEQAMTRDDMTVLVAHLSALNEADMRPARREKAHRKRGLATLLRKHMKKSFKFRKAF